ncbi:MAG: nuclear transport factor 2 family protein [Chthoniobacterales bacterium]
MKSFSVFASSFLLLCSVASLSAGETPKTGNAKSLAAAEMAFAQESLDHGTRAAFLHALSDEAIAFESGPTNAKKAWQAKPESKSVLQWQPVLAATSTSGDLGYTTGPWSFKNDRADKEAAGHGQFVSIWRWENGQWKLRFDLGSDHPAPTGAAEELQLVDNHAPNEELGDAEPVMRAHDRRYALDRAGQLAACAEDNVRVYLPKQFPIIGSVSATAALKNETAPLKFGEPKGGDISGGGDLGFVWGEYLDGAATEASGYYLRIWRKDRAGEWKLALDLLHPR